MNNNSLGQSLLVSQQNILPAAIKQQHFVPGNIQKGQLYYGLYGGNFTNLDIGTTGEVLMVISGVPTWTQYPQAGVAADRPSGGRFVADMYFATDTFAFSVWTGAAWKSTTMS